MSGWVFLCCVGDTIFNRYCSRKFNFFPEMNFFAELKYHAHIKFVTYILCTKNGFMLIFF